MAKRISVMDVLNDLKSMPANMYAVVEMNADLSDSGEPVAIIRQTFNFDEAVGVARQCRRPYIDIIAKTAKGLRWMSWVASNPRRKAKRTRRNPMELQGQVMLGEGKYIGLISIDTRSSTSPVAHLIYVDRDTGTRRRFTRVIHGRCTSRRCGEWESYITWNNYEIPMDKF